MTQRERQILDLIAVNPIPGEYAMDRSTINAAIDQAIAECSEKGIKGQGEYSLPAGARCGAHRRQVPGFQHPAGVQQRKGYCPNRCPLPQYVIQKLGVCC